MAKNATIFRFMSKNTQQNQQLDWSVTDLYDMLMYDIEPELMTESLPELDALYAGETPEEHKERMQRYADSLDSFNDRFTLLMDAWKIEIGIFKKDLSKYFGSIERSEKNKSMDEIEKKFKNS